MSGSRVQKNKYFRCLIFEIFLRKLLKMKRYNLINNITGWAVFIIAAFTYLLTIEPTASLWDCGEFIASAFKLEVGHPPGNPVFMIMARVFTLFAGGDVSKVCCNGKCNVSSRKCIYNSVPVLDNHTSGKENYYERVKVITALEDIAVMAAGVVGAMAYTFSDSFWFSAVEGEVYATSSFFTAAVFWAILKWEDVATKNMPTDG